MSAADDRVYGLIGHQCEQAARAFRRDEPAIAAACLRLASHLIARLPDGEPPDTAAEPVGRNLGPESAHGLSLAARASQRRHRMPGMSLIKLAMGTSILSSVVTTATLVLLLGG
jgi:hypothetical protein